MNIKENELLSRHVNFRVGGPAKYWCEARSVEEMTEAVALAEERNWKWAVIGGGSNTLPSDAGFDGLVIQAANRAYKINDIEVMADAGVLSNLLARKTAEAGLIGFEWAASLPGTIGGAVRGNAGCFGGEMRDVVTEVRALGPHGLLKTYTRAECEFGYRDSVFKRNSEIILSCTLRLRLSDPVASTQRLADVLAKRKAEQPFAQSSAGCMFKNFEFRHADDVAEIAKRLPIPDAFIGAKTVPAGWLIEQAGLKGTKIGGAMVSELHGNFLVNTGEASASQVLQLISLVKMKIRDLYGIQLEEEVQLLGF